MNRPGGCGKGGQKGGEGGGGWGGGLCQWTRKGLKASCAVNCFFRCSQVQASCKHAMRVMQGNRRGRGLGYVVR